MEVKKNIMKKVILLKNKINVSKKILPLLFFLSIFTIFFFVFVSNNKENILARDFHNYDEWINGTVTANLTRKIFPPMVRINPLVEKQGQWANGPYWQHIPPLYMYVPLPFIYILNHGVPSAPIIRISYITVFFLACLLFITAVYFWEGTIVALISATLASIFLLFTDFTKNLLLGYVFNNSDIVLFFSVICSFFAIGYYLKQGKEKRLKYSHLEISIIAVIVTMPIVIKTLLGAIPLATFLFLLLKDRRKILNKEIILAFLIPIVMLIIFYLPLYISSPETFMREILTPINHLSGSEGHNYPWYFYITKIIPDSYLKINMPIFYIGFVLSLYQIYKVGFSKTTRNILLLSCIWFIWDLIVVSLSSSKIPNFIFQTYIFFLFFIIYSGILFINMIFTKNKKEIENISILKYFKKPILYKTILCGIFVITILYSIKTSMSISNQMKQPQVLDSENRQFLNFAEIMRDKGVNSKDLVILYTSMKDNYFYKYDVIFNTGAESYNFRGINNTKLDITSLKRKYNNVYIILKDSIKDTSLLKISHVDSLIGEFSVITIKSENLPESFNKDLNEFIKKLPYKLR